MNKVTKKQRTVEGSVPSYEENLLGHTRNETTKLRCFMGCSVSLFLLAFVFQVLTFGFAIAIWMNTKRGGERGHED
jgi:energy-coupling factor transporter transmembrane protein EcfT